MRYAFTLFLLLLAQHAVAYTPRVLSLTGDTNIIVTSMVRDSAGNIYETGSFTQSAVIGGRKVSTGDTTPGATRMFIVELDSSGVAKWLYTEVGVNNTAATTTDMGKSVVRDPAGNIYVTGIFQCERFSLGSATFVNVDTLAGSSDIALLKISSDGSMVWAKRFGGNSDDQLSSLTIGKDGNLYADGYTSSPQINFDMLILTGNSSQNEAPLVVSFDTSGRVRWAKCYPARLVAGFQATGGDDYFDGIAADSADGVYAIGVISSDTAQIGDSVITTTGTGDHDRFMAMKFDSSGNVDWLIYSNVLIGQSYAAIVTDNQGFIEMCISYYGTTFKFDGRTVTNPAQVPDSSSAAVITRLGPDGTSYWEKIAGESQLSTTGLSGIFSTSINVSPINDDIFVAGFAKNPSTIHYDGAALPFTPGTFDLYVMKIASDGGYEWTVNGTFFGEGIVSTMSVAPDNSLFAAGLFETEAGNPLDFGGGFSLPFIATPTSFLLHITDAPASVASAGSPLASAIYPNPFSETATIQLPSEIDWHGISVTICDALGREVRRVTILTSQAVQIQRGDLTSGVYFFRAVNPQSSLKLTGKFVIQ